MSTIDTDTGEITQVERGKGAFEDRPDSRDYPLSAVAASEPRPPVDFAKGFMLPEPPNEDQYSSSSCVAQAWSYFHWQLNNLGGALKAFCRRYLYCRIYLPQGGAYIRDGGLRLVKTGQATRDEATDPNPQTEAAMRSQEGITDAQGESDRLFDLRALDWMTIEYVAHAIPLFGGVVFGVNGTNEGWQDHRYPRPPKTGDGAVWGHALYAFGYGMENGKRGIYCKSSWCSSGVTKHFISEDYFASGNVFSGWTITKKSMNQAKVVKSKTSQTVFVCYPIPSMEYLKTKAELEGFTVPEENAMPNTDTLV